MRSMLGHCTHLHGTDKLTILTTTQCGTFYVNICHLVCSWASTRILPLRNAATPCRSLHFSRKNCYNIWCQDVPPACKDRPLNNSWTTVWSCCVALCVLWCVLHCAQKYLPPLQRMHVPSARSARTGSASALNAAYCLSAVSETLDIVRLSLQSSRISLDISTEIFQAFCLLKKQL